MDGTVTGYTSCNREDGFVSKDENTVSYALAPVWILSTTYNGTPYTFIMNAQSGKFVGSLPVDKNKASMYTAAAFVVFVPILIRRRHYEKNISDLNDAPCRPLSARDV